MMTSPVVISNGESNKFIDEHKGKVHAGNNSLLKSPILSELPEESLTPELNIESRIKRRAKRYGKLSQFDNHSRNSVGANISSTRFYKNCRRSRNGYGRGLPKKGGAGGKGTWGKIGSELVMDDDDLAPDVGDPNYDPESQESCKFESIIPEITMEDLEKAVEPTIREYFEHGDTQEVILTLNEFNFGQLMPQFIGMLVNLAMDRKPSHCEMSSILLSDMYGHIVVQSDIASGFDLLLQGLADTVLDTPEASVILGNFIARAIADDCLPPKFVHGYKGKVECVHARTALEHADALLSMKHGMVRLDNVWGVGGGMRPVKYLINQMQLLLKEYICSGDATEAMRCLQELEVPHFHHEIVFEAVYMAIEDMGERTMELICKFLKNLAASIVVTPDQMINGFLRIYEDMPDICIDVPPAYTILEKFVMECEKAGFLPDEVIKKMPSRGRKRFVSEGDGGLIKTNDG